MDDIDDFFNFSKPFERIEISGGTVNGRVASNDDDKPSIKREIGLGTEYCKEYQQAEADLMLKTFSEIENKPSSSKMANASFLDELDDVHDGVNGMHTDMGDDVFAKYHFNYIPPDLPIVGVRSQILHAIENHPVTVLQGSTGCGKSTQVPQFILDEAVQRRQPCNIIVTQPRRIAARSIASRICAERKWEVGSIVGYQVGLNTNSSDDTRLLFCTTGVLLEKLIRTKSMSRYTHIILDEVHERDQDMDFLFIVVRRLLATNSPHCKVVLMSATIQASQFANYFRIPTLGGKIVAAPIIQVESRRPFVVREFYLCQLSRLCVNANVDINRPAIEPAMYDVVRKLVVVAEHIDNQDQIYLASTERHRPTILIFLPGILEIETMHNILAENADLEKLQLFPLHSSITFEEQQNVFRPVRKGWRKIVLCTNIAESSITIPDVKYVFDFCLTKSLYTDTASNFTTLQLCWASRNNCIQRAGRAGRVMDGRVYRLVPRKFYEELMDQSSRPEMLCCPLERVVLKAKILDMGEPQSILALAMDQPDLSDIQNTVLGLKELGALLRTTVVGQAPEHDGDLTYLGRVAAALPLDIRVSRLIVFGHCFSVLEECIIIAAGLNVKSIFNSPFSKALQAYSKKMRWSDGSGSDLFAILKAYRCWVAQHHQSNFNDANTERLWASRYFLNIKSLKEMAVLVQELTDRLDRLGIRERTGNLAVKWTPAEKSIILKCVTAGAFYPNYFFRAPHDESFDRDTFKTLYGRDPNTTVFFSGFNQKYIGPLYTQAIRNMFRDILGSGKSVHVAFDNNTEKIFVTFRSSRQDGELQDEYLEAVPGSIWPEVYKAVKMRKVTQGPVKLNVMNPKEAVEMAEHCGLGVVERGVFVPTKKVQRNIDMIATPRSYTKEVYGRVTYVETPHRFFVRSSDEESLMRSMFDELNAEMEPFETWDQVAVGSVVAARYCGEFHRAKVMDVVRSANRHSYRVRIMDFGMFAEVHLGDLRQLLGVASQFADIPPRVFECRLAEVQPSSLASDKGIWTPESVSAFGGLIKGMTTDVCVEIYSVVDKIAHVVLNANGANVNDFLVAEGHARVSEENYMSKQDHASRLKRQSMAFDEHTAQLDVALLEQLGAGDSDDENGQKPLRTQPTPNQCYVTLNLNGPISPLETRVSGAYGNGLNQNVLIEPQSVNSVLLDDRSQEYQCCQLVAASVTRADASQQLTARETTLLPNITGFGALMAMIFCPQLEFQQDLQRSRYTSMLCGLGFNAAANRPVFEEHDVRFELDFELTHDDLQWINQIRFTMDTMLYTKAGEERPNIPENTMHVYSQKIKTRIIELLERDRQAVIAAPYKPHTWGYKDGAEVIPISNVYGERAIFPFHSALQMTSTTAPNRIQQLQKWQANCTELHQAAELDITIPRAVLCQLCQMSLNSTAEIKIHLFSRVHLDREKSIGWGTLFQH